MSVESIHLRKLVQMLFAGEKHQLSLVRSDVRQDISRSLGDNSNGGDFYGPFWADVKDHVSGHADLRELTKYRISQNRRRERLYPVLTDGFLTWWDEQRRWTNAPFEIVKSPSTHFKFNDILTIKLENFLSVEDDSGVRRYIYPYFYERPPLKNEAARISLWVMKRAFEALPFEKFRILDVPRGRIFSPDRCYLEGDEEEILKMRHLALWKLYVEVEESRS